MRSRQEMHHKEHRHSKKVTTKPSILEPVIAEAVSKKLQLSEDVIAMAPIVTGYGTHRFCVENYRKIIEYTQELIRIQTKTVRIHIIGKNLVIAYFREDGMCVAGDISSVEYH